MRPEASPPADLPALTSLRFFAAAMIFVFHLREFAPSAWAYAIAPGMYHGVSFFFVLSGFVLTYANAGRAVSWRRFYLARLARIGPLHIVTLLLLLALLPLPAARGQNLSPAMTGATFFLKAAMLDAWVPVRGVLQSWNNVSWSISEEMAFYAAFPLLLTGMAKRPARTLAGVALLSAGTLALAAMLGLPTFSLDRYALTLFNIGSCFPLARLFEFALGMAACHVWRRWVLPAQLSFAAWTTIEAAAFAGTVLWLVFVIPRLVGALDGAIFVWLRASGSCFVFALLIAAMAGAQGALGRWLSLRPFVALGEASFAFYMVHMIVMRTLSFHFGAGAGVISALALSLGLAFLLHEGVEIPMRRRVLALGGRPPGYGLKIIPE